MCNIFCQEDPRSGGGNKNANSIKAPMTLWFVDAVGRKILLLWSSIKKLDIMWEWKCRLEPLFSKPLITLFPSPGRGYGNMYPALCFRHVTGYFSVFCMPALSRADMPTPDKHSA